MDGCQIMKNVRCCADRFCKGCSLQGKAFCKETLFSYAWNEMYNLTTKIDNLTAEIERLKATKKLYLDRWEESIKLAHEDEINSIKEFAELVKANKNKLFNYIYSSRGFDEQIDNLVKEMGGVG